AMTCPRSMLGPPTTTSLLPAQLKCTTAWHSTSRPRIWLTLVRSAVTDQATPTAPSSSARAMAGGTDPPARSWATSAVTVLTVAPAAARAARHGLLAGTDD